MINTKISIGVHYVLNNTDEEWFEFQHNVQEALDTTALHCLPKGEMKLLMEPQQFKDSELFYEIWGRYDDMKLDVAILKVRDATWKNYEQK